MKSIDLNTVITGIRAKVDGSLGLTMGTPEMTPEQKAEIMKLQGVNLKTTIEPLETKVPKLKIDTELNAKTPSQRLRGVIFVWWEQMGRPDEFEVFYKKTMEKIIDQVKDKLD